MSKIKEIHERLVKNPSEYTEIRFLVAKRTLAFFIFLYFMSLMFAIGRFSIGPLDVLFLWQLTFHIYSVLILVIGWFLYEASLYLSHVYFGEKKWPILIFGVMIFVFVTMNIVWHLGASYF